ncbi:GNAT family N-acetyltransferase [Agromyces protaetiae]|uniref:GNAT family N-acetyltransferase n=1 Tax=Agromyces protaetiae TaxID=2509455 RepID=A0A4P6FFX4_9MICO|nr:GNAT family N-acetyltransferase [Agromyces protaetiae]
MRAAEPSDLRALAALAAETFPLACPPHVTAESVAAFVEANLSEARFADYLADSERAVLVAGSGSGSGSAAGASGDALVGYAMLVAGEPVDAHAAAVTQRPTIELSKFYTRSVQHGSGLAASLMQVALEVAAATGAATCWLGVNQLNARAIRFYERHGFTKIGEKRFLVGDRLEHDFVFERDLVGDAAAAAEGDPA